MVNISKILGIILARGGSQRVPRKNIREVYGKPLIAWTIEEAFKSLYVDKVILSSDNDEIIGIARDFGCEIPFKRPSELACDTTSSVEPVLHALRTLHDRFDYFVLLQPTSPLRLAEDIDCCIEMCIGQNANSCVSVTDAAERSHRTHSQSWMFSLDSKGIIGKIVTMNDNNKNFKDLYMVNGAVYAVNVNWFLRSRMFIEEGTLAYVMPTERSIDIDYESDLATATSLFEERERNDIL